MSIRLRLTLWYTTIFTTTLVIFSVAVWIILSNYLTLQIDNSLLQTAEQVLRATEITAINDVPYLSMPPHLDTFQASNLYIQLFDSFGRWEASSRNLGEIRQPLDPIALENVPSGISYSSESYIGGLHMRVLTLRIEVEDQTLGYLQVGQSMVLVDDARNGLLGVLIVGSIVSVLVAGAIGSLTARRALRPLRMVTHTAQNITKAHDLSQRIPYTGAPNDDLGSMVATFNETLNQIENLFYAQRRFLADVSHELRTPLTSIRGNLDLMRMMQELDPESLEAIQSEASRMTRLVDDLLLLAQAETGQMTLADETVQLDDLMLEVYRDATVLAGGRIQVVLADEDQVCVSGDRDRLKQVLLNLISNAIKYTPNGGKVSLGLTAKHGFARLRVSDTGPGIPAEDQPYIFDRFYRVEKARTRDKHTNGHISGSGLGLSIAKWIVDAHQGRIQFVSSKSQGTTFYIWLPIAKPDKNGGTPSKVNQLLTESTANLVSDLSTPNPPN